jgi:hypothetical protein
MDCTDHISAFHAAATLDDLQTAFKTAYKAAQVAAGFDGNGYAHQR